ncbi:hypothetical protein CONPUDRAFT_136359 [Coniophora puteana RWD-64-598 SS2]|uniref:F-box domain-containing protein n=1 Tax=Coniophora puteana (strain RWD-64-598) TaxID=741705 RepID=A0A5M3MWA3_CONPW|nr:uncharacterized protein CONPUDRAFT_136359 [Coniophora puteana RWD-64-598 SS2]EIW83267.1 hypothetical protein CONPUDRAFT_136359 [Coniophora puteana RWD-64-598 SS2]
MSKRRLSPEPLPHPKRHNVNGTPSSAERRILVTFESSLYDELLLFIFSLVDSRDLCALQATNRHCSRLARDNQLWKALYLKEYGRARLRGGRGFFGRADGREIKPLPQRALAGPSDVEDYKDWKWMYRISSNWRTGRCSLENVDSSYPPPGPSSPSHTGISRSPRRDKTLVLLAGNATIIAEPEASIQPTISVRSASGDALTLICKSTLHDEPICITALAIDQSSRTTEMRLAAFLSTGEFSVFTLPLSSSSSSSPSTLTILSPKLTYIPTSRRRSSSPVSHAAYHHPLLLTLSHGENFTLAVYDMALMARGKIDCCQTLTSFTSYPPTSLVLSVLPSLGKETYKAVVTCAVPVYPSHWSVGATELIVARAGDGTASGSSGGGQKFDENESLASLTETAEDVVSGPFEVKSTRTARASDVPQGWIEERVMSAMRAQYSRKVESVADTQTDGKWVVLAPGEALPTVHAHASTSASNNRTPVSSDDPSTSEEEPSSPSSSSHSPSTSHSSYISPPHHSSTSLQLYRLSMPPLSSSFSSPASSSTGLSPRSTSAHPPKLTFVRTLRGPVGPVSALALADGRCVALGARGGIWVWDLENGGSGGGRAASPDAEGVGVAQSIEDAQFVGIAGRGGGVGGTVAFDERTILSAGPRGVEVRRFDV